MTINPNNASLAVARSLMEQALEAPNGVRVQCANKPEAERLQKACNQARTAQRRVNARVFGMDAPAGQSPGSSETSGGLATGLKGHDPDAIRTHYDNLVTYIEPGPDASAFLVIAKPDLSAFKILPF